MTFLAVQPGLTLFGGHLDTWGNGVIAQEGAFTMPKPKPPPSSPRS